MELTKRVPKYAEDDIFYSDSEAEQDLNNSLKAVNSSKTAFKMGHTVGVQDAVACVASWNKKRHVKEHSQEQSHSQSKLQEMWPRQEHKPGMLRDTRNR
jgi:hypothetical protein